MGSRRPSSARQRALAEIAFHEAGHVVVGHLLGLRVIDADLDADREGGLGHTNFDPRPPAGIPRRHHSELVVTTLLAGAAVDARRGRPADWSSIG